MSALKLSVSEAKLPLSHRQEGVFTNLKAGSPLSGGATGALSAWRTTVAVAVGRKSTARKPSAVSRTRPCTTTARWAAEAAAAAWSKPCSATFLEFEYQTCCVCPRPIFRRIQRSRRPASQRRPPHPACRGVARSRSAAAALPRVATPPDERIEYSSYSTSNDGACGKSGGLKKYCSILLQQRTGKA